MKHIFLVEDDNSIAKNLIILLSSEGFIVTHASTRSEALAAFVGKKFDLALIDISLPDGNGFTVCTEIKEIQDIPIIFITASGDEASVVTDLNMGADDYITKPFRPRELIARTTRSLLRFPSTIMAQDLKRKIYPLCLTGFIVEKTQTLQDMGLDWLFVR